MTHTEIQEIHRKLALPTIRDKSGSVIPTDFSDKELHFIVFEMMHEMREENKKRNRGVVFQKHWNKASKKERK